MTVTRANSFATTRTAGRLKLAVACNTTYSICAAWTAKCLFTRQSRYYGIFKLETASRLREARGLCFV